MLVPLALMVSAPAIAGHSYVGLEKRVSPARPHRFDHRSQKPRINAGDQMPKLSALIAILLTLAGCTASDARQASVVEANTPAIGERDQLVQSVGIETLGGVFTPLLLEGCSIPCSISQVFSTADDGQRHIDIHPYRGKCEHVAQCHSLGTYRVSGFMPGPRGQPRISVSLRAAAGDLTLSANEAGRSLAVERVAF